MKVLRPKFRASVSLSSGKEDLAQDMLSLFTKKIQGHMEKWEYGPSMFSKDPAGGSEHWGNLVKNPGAYYPKDAEIETIHWAIQQEQLRNELSTVSNVVELGPGSHEAIMEKTIPFLQMCSKLKKYIAVDATPEQATDASQTVQKILGISSGVRNQDFLRHPLVKPGAGKTALVMWGISLGNIDGFAAESPMPKLVKTLQNFKAGLKPNDLMAVCFDTENDEQKILDAYREPALHSQVLSILHRLKRDGYVNGNFDPKVWNHEPVWYPEVGQCAHIMYPLFKQKFDLGGTTIEIPAYDRLISNNSYKFSEETIKFAACQAGWAFAFCLKQGPIAMVIARA